MWRLIGSLWAWHVLSQVCMVAQICCAAASMPGSSDVTSHCDSASAFKQLLSRHKALMLQQGGNDGLIRRHEEPNCVHVVSPGERNLPV